MSWYLEICALALLAGATFLLVSRARLSLFGARTSGEVVSYTERMRSSRGERRSSPANERPRRRYPAPQRESEGKMAKKKLAAIVKIQIPAGQATPAPPVGTALGPHGINIMDFCKAYNAATENQRGLVIPAEISIYEDRTFTFVTKTPPTPFLLRQAAGIEKGAANPRTDKAGKVTAAQVRQIAETKMPDLNAIDLDGAILQVAGTARSMGIAIEG